MVEIMYWQLWMLTLLLDTLSSSRTLAEEVDQQMEFSGFLECVQDFTLESVCDLTWSHFAL